MDCHVVSTLLAMTSVLSGVTETGEAACLGTTASTHGASAFHRATRATPVIPAGSTGGGLAFEKHGQVNSALRIDFITFNGDGLADFDQIIGISDVFGTHPGNVDETIFTGKNLDEGAIRLDAGNSTLIDFADFGGSHHPLDISFGLVDLGLVHTSDGD